MTAFTYQRGATAGSCGLARMGGRVRRKVGRHEVLFGTVVWFAVVFLMAKAYLGGIG